MWNQIQDLLSIPPEILPDFWRDSLHKNRLSLLIISHLMILAQLFNIGRVLFFSASGLRTANNRLYFFMYCVLLFGAALALLIQHLLRKASLRAQWIHHALTALFFLLWHICLNIHDLTQNPPAHAYPFLMAIIGFAMFSQMPYAMSVVYFVLGYGLFMFFGASSLYDGDVVNLTMLTFVAMFISFFRCHHAVVELRQRAEITQINAQLQEMLEQDPLTGLFNKTAAQARISRCLENRTKTDALILFMLDLDNFKSINDQYGHPCGDHVLEETAQKLRSLFYDAMCIGRIGGDEFIVLLSPTSDIETSKLLGKQFLRSLSEIRWMEQPLCITCSIGALYITQPDANYEQLYSEVDRALYEAKQQGKGRCCFRVIS